jgi:hypothetical protein
MRYGLRICDAGIVSIRAATSQGSTRLDIERERLAYLVCTELGERDYPARYGEPLGCVIDALRGSRTVRELDARLPAELV